jgi:NAD(P)-dependent dehydrogenase (short-subunit alcohol dehydrogenase family)
MAIDMRDTSAFAEFVARFGAVDLYVSNHGILDGRREGETVEIGAVASEVLAINLQSAIDALHVVLPGMRTRGKGRSRWCPRWLGFPRCQTRRPIRPVRRGW